MISIAMATYNGEKFLREQIESIFAQTVTDWELVACDDCSTDSTLNILREYEAKDSRIHVFQNDENLGFKRNFERVISLCRNDFVALCDQDDIWIKNHLERLLELIEDKSMAVANARIMSAAGELTEELLSDRDRYYVDGNDCDRLYRILFSGNPFQGTSSMLRKELLLKAMPIPDDVIYHDAWFSACACCNRGIAYSFEPITQYRIHGANVSGNHHRTFIERIRINLKRKKYKNDRAIFCRELACRFPNMPTNIRNVVAQGNTFYEWREKNQKLKVVAFLIKHYKKVYATKSYRYVVLRCIKYLVR